MDTLLYSIEVTKPINYLSLYSITITPRATFIFIVGKFTIGGGSSPPIV